jgi:alkanesulfonate monooxygenase SsuD/methylene tetrahydromethanopterin reductase-like flavin-dependent oxidoreductase (luciferase family)
VLRQHCRDAGRDYDSIVKSISFEPVIVHETEPEARAIADRAREASGDRDWDDTALVGTPAQCIERIRAYEEIGVSYFILYFQGAADDLEPLRLFADQVLPAFRSH